MMRRERISVREAEDIADDVAAAVCRSCSAATEEGSLYCFSCKSYWDEADAELWSNAEWED